MLVHVLTRLLGRKQGSESAVKPLDHVAAVEMNAHCQKVLLDSPSPPAHLFTNQNHFWKPKVWKQIQSLRSGGVCISLESLVPLIKGKPVRSAAFCICCKKICEHPRANMHQGSPPCVAFSSMGNHSTTEGDTMVDFAAWCAMRLLLEEPIVIMEESEKFDPAIITQIFGETHRVFCKKIDALTFGWPGRRERLWVVLFHNKYVHEVL